MSRRRPRRGGATARAWRRARTRLHAPKQKPASTTATPMEVHEREGDVLRPVHARFEVRAEQHEHALAHAIGRPCLIIVRRLQVVPRVGHV